MHFAICLVTFLLVILPGVSHKPLSIRVAVAANAQFPMKEIEAIYEEETGHEVTLIVSSSGKLTAQIKAGAPYDIFLSADMEYPVELYKSGYASTYPQVYGYGTLVLWTAGQKLTFSSLASDEVATVAVANPKLAPYGKASLEVLKYYGVYEKVYPKLVYGESIGQVNQYILNQAVDVGFTSKSLVLSSGPKLKGKWFEVEPKAYTPMAQGVVLLKGRLADTPAEVKHFYNFLFSPRAKEIFSKYGYAMPQ